MAQKENKLKLLIFYGNKFCGESGASLQLKLYKTKIHCSWNIEIPIKLVIVLNEKHMSNSLGYKKLITVTIPYAIGLISSKMLPFPPSKSFYLN